MLDKFPFKTVSHCVQRTSKAHLLSRRRVLVLLLLLLRRLLLPLIEVGLLLRLAPGVRRRLVRLLLRLLLLLLSRCTRFRLKLELLLLLLDGSGDRRRLLWSGLRLGDRRGRRDLLWLLGDGGAGRLGHCGCRCGSRHRLIGKDAGTAGSVFRVHRIDRCRGCGRRRGQRACLQ